VSQRNDDDERKGKALIELKRCRSPPLSRGDSVSGEGGDTCVRVRVVKKKSKDSQKNSESQLRGIALKNYQIFFFFFPFVRSFEEPAVEVRVACVLLPRYAVARKRNVYM